MRLFSPWRLKVSTALVGSLGYELFLKNSFFSASLRESMKGTTKNIPFWEKLRAFSLLGVSIELETAQ